MDTEKIIFGVATAIVVPIAFAVYRWGTKLTQRVQDTENFISFLKAYLLKNAVLEFHSPDPKHKAADRAIERLVDGRELSAEEIDTLARRIQGEAKHAEDTKRRLKAQTTLVLMDEFMESVTGHRYTAFSEYD